MSATTNRFRSLAINLVLMAVAFTLLGFSLWSNREQIRSVMERPIDYRLFVVAFLVYFTALILTFGRWYLLVRALNLPFRFRDALRLGFIGNVFNLVIPGAIGGDVIKAAYLCREQARKTQAVSTMVIDRAVGLLGLFLLASVSGLVAYGQMSAEPQRLIRVVWVASITGLVGLGLIFTPALYRPLLSLLKGRGRVEIFFQELVAMAATYRSKIGLVTGLLLGSSLIHSLYVAAFFLVSRALFPASSVTLLDHFVVVPLTLFSTAIPLPFGALGVSENIADQLFQLVGYQGGALAMMGFRILMYVGGLISVLVYVANLRQVRELSSELEETALAPQTAPAKA